MGRNYLRILYVKAYISLILNHMFLPEYRLILPAFYDYLLTIKGERDNFYPFLFNILKRSRHLDLSKCLYLQMACSIN